jgi:hypothetical protein
MRSLKGILTLLTFLLTEFSLIAQSDNTAVIQQQFDKYKDQYLEEKIFVHADRSFYVAGEIIWFKVYCTNENNSRRQHLSKVAYLEVLNQDQQPVLQAKIALKNGSGNGSLVVPSDMQSGNYILRSYTNWMKNSDPEFYFHQNLTIVNTLRADTVAVAKVAESFDIQFFPEGGDLINGLKSKVAFRVTDQSGKGIDFAGVIADENNDTVLHFKPSVFGIGSFTFTPQKNRQYKALITTIQGKVVAEKIPSPLNSGYTMNVADLEKDGRLKIKVETNTDSKSAFLFIHTRKQVKTAQLLLLTNGKAELELHKSDLGDGISHITLFNINNEPVCERLYFKRPAQQLVISATTESPDYLPRKKVTVDILSQDESNQPHAADLSMAVFLIDSLPFSYKDIHSYLWIASDLKGKVESPEYYLGNNSLQADEALDNLMLTHGWRKFKWTDVLQHQKHPLTFLPEYEGHIVRGKIVNRLTGSPGEKMQAFLSVPGRDFHLYNSISNSNGIVNFNTRNFYGTRLTVALVNTGDTTVSYRIDLSNPFSESYSNQKIPPFSAITPEPLKLLKRSINMQVHNVYAGNSLHTFETQKADTVNFYGKPEKRYLLDDYTRFPTMEEVLTEYVPEIGIRKRHDKFSLRLLNKDENGNPIIKEPVVLLDGIPQFDLGNKIAHHDPLKIERLETINKAYFLGTVMFNGIASFFTYKGDLAEFQLDTSSTVLDYEALQLRREFYSPVYETSDQYTSRLPDNRTLIYWSPDVKTNDKGTKQASFYTSDLPGKYAVVVQGISDHGHAGSKMFMIEVKKDPLLTR